MDFAFGKRKWFWKGGDLCFFSAISSTTPSSTTPHVSMVCTCVHKKIMKQLLFQPDIKCSDKRSTSLDKMTPQIATIVTTWCFPIIHNYGVYGRIHTHRISHQQSKRIPNAQCMGIFTYIYHPKLPSFVGKYTMHLRVWVCSFSPRNLWDQKHPDFTWPYHQTGWFTY